MDNPKRIFPPNGRLRQRDYVLWQLLLIVVGIALFGLAFSSIPGILFLMIGVGIYEIYITAKRLQDCNFSGWFSLLLLLPTINGLVVLIMCFYPGTKGLNEFGADPCEKYLTTDMTKEDYPEASR